MSKKTISHGGIPLDAFTKRIQLIERKRILGLIKNSPKTFGMIDKKGFGGAILIKDIEELLANNKDNEKAE